jgi:hypothetical protein
MGAIPTGGVPLRHNGRWDELTDVAAENIDLTAKLLLNDDRMRWLVANCLAPRANPSGTDRDETRSR